MKYYDKLIFDLSKAGRQGYSLPSRTWDATLADMPAGTCRQDGSDDRPQAPSTGYDQMEECHPIDYLLHRDHILRMQGRPRHLPEGGLYRLQGLSEQRYCPIGFGYG